jgi:hypothetical protein
MELRPCIVCESETRWEYRSGDFSVRVCNECGHREADHSAAPKSDYYEHTPTGDKFVRSLETTRRRQARAILDTVVPLLDETDGWLDFGCGRGVFLEEARARGLETLGGYETSVISKSWLTERGIPMAESQAGEAFWPDWESLPFAPHVVSLLDVLEHFPGAQAEAAIRRIVGELSDLKRIVIKVPVSDGVLFRTARAAKGIAPGIYRQLFQVGTFPPHFHYFSRASLAKFLEKAGLELESVWDDSDLDNLFHRIPSLSFLPGGGVAASIIGAFPGDTRVVSVKISRK